MKKLLFIFSIFLLLGNASFSQPFFNHTFHTGFSMLADEHNSAVGPNVGYTPRLNIPVTSFASVNVASNISVLLVGADAFALTLPLMAGFTIGNSATEDVDFPIGMYFNIGYGGMIFSFDEDEGLAKGMTYNVFQLYAGRDFHH
jgi:hypothetical protein